ncbi:DUF3021 family protein, partial [Brachybacterium sp. AOP35-5H-19]|uniref:DUF3021 family protein n=1 Tax=Brachybacterium sp. AOP35-5H-19 TaxID=3457685 RepID=UPI0040336B8E
LLGVIEPICCIAYPGCMKRAVRFLLSGVLTLVIMLALSFAIDDPAQARGTRTVGVIVGVVIAAIPIYDIDRWSLLKRTIVHTAVMAGTVIPCLIFSGWFDLNASTGVLALVGTFVGFGVVGWGIGFIITRLLYRRSKVASSDSA